MAYATTPPAISTFTATCLYTLKVEPFGIVRGACAFNPDGSLLTTAGKNGTVLWNTATGECWRTVGNWNDVALSCAFSPDGNMLASILNGVTLRNMRADNYLTPQGAVLHTLNKQGSSPTICAFSPDSCLLAIANKNNTIDLWNTRINPMQSDRSQNVCVRTLQGHTAEIVSCDFSHDGQLLATASYDGTVSIWDPNTGTCLRTLAEHNGPHVYCCAFSHSGLLATASGTLVKLWNPRTGICLGTLEDIQEPFCCAFNHTSQLLVTGNRWGIVKLWDVPRGTWLCDLNGHDNEPIVDCTFSPVDDLFATAGYDNTVKVWKVIPRPQTPPPQPRWGNFGFTAGCTIS